MCFKLLEFSTMCGGLGFQISVAVDCLLAVRTVGCSIGACLSYINIAAHISYVYRLCQMWNLLT